MSVRKYFNAIIIGGGAGGLMCAVSAKEKNENLSVAIIEKNERVGKKLLSTGNGRCNLTNKNITIDKYTGSFKAKSNIIFKKFSTEYLLNIFKKLGLITYCDAEGRYYPISKQASSVLDVLRFSCDRLGVETFCGENIKSIKKIGKKFTILTETTEYISDKLIIACGSKAAPKLGGNASSYDYLKNFGHSFSTFSPALCPIIVKNDILKSLKGLRVTGKASLISNKNEIIKSEIGEIQFTDKSLSGICIFNLSLYSKKDYKISLDLMPDYSINELYTLISNQKNLYASFSVENILTGIFQKRIALAILKLSRINSISETCCLLSDDDAARICQTIKNMSFKVISNDDFNNAQCTLGGVQGKEINEYTMESKLVKNLYICGEVIDICGECGGYNLHFAFASGYIAGENL